MKKNLSHVFVLLGFFIVTSGNVLAQQLSMDRGPSWQSNVAELRAGIGALRIPVYKMKTELINSIASADYQANNSNSEKLEKNDVVEMEAKNIWWVQRDDLYIRLFNPAARSINSVVLSIVDGSCSSKESSGKMFLLLELTPSQLKEGRYMVYSGGLPFVYRDYFKKGTACAIVESAYMKRVPKVQKKSMVINSKDPQVGPTNDSKMKQGFEWGDVRIITKD